MNRGGSTNPPGGSAANVRTRERWSARLTELGRSGEAEQSCNERDLATARPSARTALRPPRPVWRTTENQSWHPSNPPRDTNRSTCRLRAGTSCLPSTIRWSCAIPGGSGSSIPARGAAASAKWCRGRHGDSARPSTLPVSGSCAQTAGTILSAAAAVELHARRTLDLSAIGIDAYSLARRAADRCSPEGIALETSNSPLPLAADSADAISEHALLLLPQLRLLYGQRKEGARRCPGNTRSRASRDLSPYTRALSESTIRPGPGSGT